MFQTEEGKWREYAFAYKETKLRELQLYPLSGDRGDIIPPHSMQSTATEWLSESQVCPRSNHTTSPPWGLSGYLTADRVHWTSPDLLFPLKQGLISPSIWLPISEGKYFSIPALFFSELRWLPKIHRCRNFWGLSSRDRLFQVLSSPCPWKCGC